MIVHVDKEDFVISVEHENSIVREIHRSEVMPEATRICKGPWHYKGGKGTVLPISAFPENRYRKGSQTKTCGECLEKSGKRSAVPLGVKAMPEADSPPLDPANGGPMHKWLVTIVKPTTVTVYAKDYVSAGVEAGEGEITDVKRLD